VKTILNNDHGMALAVLTMLIAILASMTGAALLFSRIDLMISGNYRTGTGALYAADAGVGVAISQIQDDPEDSQAAIPRTVIGDYAYWSYDPAVSGSTPQPIQFECDQSGYSRSSGMDYNNAGNANLGIRNYTIYIMGTGPLNSAARKIQALSQDGPTWCPNS